MTMTKPEMDVVRFNESDVMCASSDIPTPPVDSFVVSGASDGISGNMLIDGGSVESFEETLRKTHSDTNAYFKYKENNPVYVKDLANHDVTGDLGDGIYKDKGEQLIFGDVWARLFHCQ